MKSSIVLPLIMMLTAGPAHASVLAQAQAAYARFEVNESERLFEDVLEDDRASAEDKAVAQRELARISWLIDGDSGEPWRRLEASLRTDPDPCPTAYLYARILNDALSPDQVRSKIEPYSRRCLSIEPGVALQGLRSRLREARAGSSVALQVARAKEALAGLDALPASARAPAEASRLRLALGILARDPEEAMKGWRGYFWLPDGHLAVPGLGLNDQEIESRFRDGLAQTSKRPATLATLLMRAGFLEALKDFLALQPSNGNVAEDQESRRVSAYLSFREQLDSVILAHDRAYARGSRSSEEAYEEKLSTILKETAASISPGADDSREILREAFGLYGTDPGKSNGVSGIHLGHVVHDEMLAVEQDGRSGKIRLIVLDNMVHNSFSSWLMDGASGVGGWAADGDTIVQVRPRYLLLIDRFSRLAEPGPALDRELQEIRSLRAADRKIAKENPISFLPGVRASLRLRGIQSIAASLPSTATGEQRSREFRRAYWDALIASSITAHEGRHILDQSQFGKDCPLPDEELEYRAKLSEIRFSPVPQLALSSIFSPLFGGSSGHGKANKRLMSDYASWIEHHGEDISDYHPAISPLEQLDLLTPSQLIQVAQSLEPPVGAGCR